MRDNWLYKVMFSVLSCLFDFFYITSFNPNPNPNPNPISVI